ncbi:MAG: hypothetical protein K0S01_2432 [Herbinix sp.]|jgi:hypothetical protein|nr:hypothetical protein [Herbinix sp.]
MMELNYQYLINLVIMFLMLAMPIGFIFGFAEKILNMFLSMVFGDKYIKL